MTMSNHKTLNFLFLYSIKFFLKMESSAWKQEYHLIY